MINFSPAVKPKRRINLTPLIDIIFLLVVFFMLTSKFVTAQILDLNVSTLQDSSGSSNDALVITLLPDDRFAISGEEFELALLGSKIKDSIKVAPAKDVVIISRDGVKVQNLVAAMDDVKAAGGLNISLAEEG
jgi:biopolymer transport protein ExbD